MVGEGKNNFIIEYNEPENRLAELEEAGLTDDDFDKTSFEDTPPENNDETQSL